MPRKTLPVYRHNPNDQRPIIEQLMDALNAPLDYVDMPQRYYSVTDVLRGVTGQRNPKYYLSEFASAESLYQIIQLLPNRSKLVQSVKQYLMDAGVIPGSKKESGEKVADRKRWEKLGRSESWIDERIKGVVSRNRFTGALKQAVYDGFKAMYALATDEVYFGLWDRTTAILRRDLEIAEKEEVRDHFTEYALLYTRLTEMTCEKRLNDANEVSFEQAKHIIQAVAIMFHEQARETSRALGIDLVTGKPLLKG